MALTTQSLHDRVDFIERFIGLVEDEVNMTSPQGRPLLGQVEEEEDMPFPPGGVDCVVFSPAESGRSLLDSGQAASIMMSKTRVLPVQIWGKSCKVLKVLGVLGLYQI